MNASPRRHESSLAVDVPSLNTLSEHPEFKMLVKQQARLYVQKAVRDGRLRPGRVYNQFLPRMDLLDDESVPFIAATFELPGVRPQDLKLEVVDKTLILSGQRCLHLQRTPGVESCLALRRRSRSKSPSNNPRSVTPHRVRIACELRYGTFSRSIFLPQDVKANHICARLEYGMLTVTWPRTAPMTKTEVDDTSSDSITIHDGSMSRSIAVVPAVQNEIIELRS